jgi:hypothetical protein
VLDHRDLAPVTLDADGKLVGLLQPRRSVAGRVPSFLPSPDATRFRLSISHHDALYELVKNAVHGELEAACASRRVEHSRCAARQLRRFGESLHCLGSNRIR